MKTILLFLISLSMGTVFLSGQSIDQLAREQQAKVSSSLEKLNALREEIQRKQIPLAKEVITQENKIKDLRKQLSQKQSARDNKSLSLENLQNKFDAEQKQYNYIIGNLLGEFSSTFEASLSSGEILKYQEKIRELNLLLEDPDTPEEDRIRESLALVSDSLQRIQNSLGGQIYEGQALTQTGEFLDGQFVQVGPILYFSADPQPGETQTGLIEETKTFQARILPLQDKEATQVNNVANTGNGLLPVDTSLGNALALAETKDSLSEHIQKGGVWVYPILFFALLSTVIALVKVVQIFKIRHPAPSVINQLVALIKEGKKEDALALAQKQPQPAADMLASGVQSADESVELLEEILYESMLNTKPRLERFLNIIAVTAAIAPLLGLLGTVTGIIKTFKLMNIFGAGDPQPLISGISEALITTELGLILAIPALIIYSILSRKVTGVMAQLEKLAVSFVNTMSKKS